MEGQDIIHLPASSNSVSGSESGELRDLDDGPHQVDSQPNNAETNDGETKAEIQGLIEGDIRNAPSHLIVEAEVDNTLLDNSSDMEISDEITETGRVEEKVDEDSSGGHSESYTVEKKMVGSSVPNKKRSLDVQNGSPIQNNKMDGFSVSGVKRPRLTFDDQQPSVHIVYNSLTRASKQKLEEFLQKWSEWQAEHCSSSQDQNELLESGEETYFPALRVGAEKPSAVSFWIDNQTRNLHDTKFIPLDGDIVPLYDRGYAMGLTSADGSSNLEGRLEIKDDPSRCFNCGSYSHSLKQCPKPRDNVAVNAARKQHYKRNQNTASRSAIRYYQNCHGGKYEDLKPGVLGAETRQLLGLGEFDPPPWLHRMREIGYPPGYLAPDDEDQPSGITIYGDEETNEGQEDGEITEMVHSEPQRKMAVEFPGINAPIPVEADEKLWAPLPSSSESSRSRPHRRLSHSSEAGSRGHHQEQRYFGDFEDEGPPRVDSRFSSSYPPRYGDYDSPYSFHSPRDVIPRPRSPTFGRPYSDRGRRSPVVYQEFAFHGSYSSSQYSPSDRRNSPRIYGSARSGNELDERWNNRYPDYSY
ncbi:hypothetical protein DITRI_Ditri13aG0063600 [Diplodiscus trichospermus]